MYAHVCVHLDIRIRCTCVCVCLHVCLDLDNNMFVRTSVCAEVQLSSLSLTHTLRPSALFPLPLTPSIHLYERYVLSYILCMICYVFIYRLFVFPFYFQFIFHTSVCPFVCNQIKRNHPKACIVNENIIASVVSLQCMKIITQSDNTIVNA